MTTVSDFGELFTQATTNFGKLAAEGKLLPEDGDPYAGRPFGTKLAKQCAHSLIMPFFQHVVKRERNTTEEHALPIINFWVALGKLAARITEPFKQFAGLNQNHFKAFVNKEVDQLIEKLRQEQGNLALHFDGKSVSIYLKELPASQPEADPHLLEVNLSGVNTANLKLGSVGLLAKGALPGHGPEEISLTLREGSTNFKAVDRLSTMDQGDISLAGNEAFQKLVNLFNDRSFLIEGKPFFELVQSKI